MATLLIAYDLADAEGAADLTVAIQSLGVRWARPLASLWYVETDKSPGELETELSSLLGMDDGLLVQRTAGEAVLTNTMLRWTARPDLTGPAELGAQIIAWPDARPIVAEAA